MINQSPLSVVELDISCWRLLSLIVRLFSDLRSVLSSQSTLKSPMIITCEVGCSSKVEQMATKRDDSASVGDLYTAITIKSVCSTVFSKVSSIPRLFPTYGYPVIMGSLKYTAVP